MLANDPDLLAGQMLGAHVSDALGWAVSDTHAHSGKTRGQTAFRAATPTDLLPSGCLQHCLRGDRLRVGDMPLARAATPANGEDHRHIDGIDLLLERDADCPVEAARGERLPEGRAQAI